MKQIYLLLFLISGALYAQTTVSYPQRVANYNTFFTDGGGNFDDGTVQFGMWANGGNTKSVAWRNFTEDGTTTGTPSTMAVGDSFTITVSATQASFGVIGLALLSSPTAKTTWADRISNYAVQVNLNGNGGANDPWEVVSEIGTVDASAIGSSQTYADSKFTFTLDAANTMTVSINDGAYSKSVTLNTQNITGYSIYFDNDWNGTANANIFWKPTTEYTYAATLGNTEFNLDSTFSMFPNPVNNTFSINEDINRLQIFDLTGKLVKEFKGNFSKNKTFDVSTLVPSVYFLQIETADAKLYAKKLVKY